MTQVLESIGLGHLEFGFIGRRGAEIRRNEEKRVRML